ncbi:type IV secretory system conjugative DNA transfer family protein [Micromonospora sp. WMMD1082]|uniref:type IV secretory system conjugative DNA transfer family protein n=1 Tax=Micromonospora sp. WMMD1082 TaxID=3016104 RepID=UPI002415B6BA|nr:type IV secretory system conjugative DNA transfer family protein [Micromonospora sp. WMMD1082]MDG4792434.1 type IV secretory system conjugative DNA transfer family protein [Micromonospora sp. WMMD1082]
MAEQTITVDVARLLREVRRKHSGWRITYRYLSGRPLDGRRGYPWRRRGPGRLAGWQRQAYRLGIPAGTALTMAYPEPVAAGVTSLAVALAWRGRQKFVRRRFHAAYIAPTLAAVTVPLGQTAGVRLHVDPTLGSLTPRLARPLSPAEVAVRAWYGARLEPIVRWLPEQLQRGLWAAQRRARPVTGKLDVFRRPAPAYGPRIELAIAAPYLTKEQRQLVSSIITSKIPVSGLVESWDQVGPKVVARWTVRARPPASVGHERVLEHLPRLAEWEFYVGDGVGGQAVVISLRDDSPHIAVSAGSGAGKSVLAQLIAVQVLARGGRVVILDRKGSHRALLGLPGVDYCTRPAQMHDALLRLDELADERNTLALHEPEDWDPGARTLVIAEELNATIGQLANWWADNRSKGEPKRSPAISALANLLFMGRSAKVNVIAIAQMLTARAIGGPEARENFGIRCLARYTANNWKMLVPEAAMPKASRTLGRWQIVIGGQSTEVQVAYLNKAQVQAIVTPEVPDSAVSRDVPGDGDMMTLRDAVDHGVLPWSYGAAKKRLQRRVGTIPPTRGKRGNADLYARQDLTDWVTSGK